MDAWVTSAIVDAEVNKAIVLAGSLRRVRTAKKLAVLTSNNVSRALREKLKLAFDLVVSLEPETPSYWNLEDYAKVEGFSLTVFKKCVYVSPNSLVLQNCDEIFHKYGEFAVSGKDDDLDFSVYLFTPSMKFSKALKNMYEGNGGDGKNYQKTDFGKCFSFWIMNNIPNWEKLDEEYTGLLRLNNGTPKSLGTTMTIVKFGDEHPLDLAPDGGFAGLQELGTIEKFVAQLCRTIFKEDVVEPVADCWDSDRIFKTEPIAIIGLAFRLPGCNNVEEFWDLLDNGKDAIKVLPQARWSQEHTYLANGDQDFKVEGGFLTVPVDEFDAKFFGISGKEAEFMDPQQRLLHEVGWEALEEAMIDPTTLAGTQTGVFVGSWLDDYKDMVRRQIDADFFRVYMGNSIATGAGRLSHFLEVTGPSVATESGCSSSIVAVDMACKSLRNHDSNLALACGVNLILKPVDKDLMSFVVSPDGRCKTFDKGANGFGRAEGCAVLIMKRLSDAVRADDNIWGLIRGSAMTQEGCSKSLGTPTVHCESLAMELALKDANVDPLDVSYIEAHGTGTAVGDPMEIAAIAKAYSKGRSEPLVIGSVKTNVGHTESVSGITGIIKVLLSMKNEKIPKHLHFKELNPAINLDVIPAKLPIEPIPWSKRPDKPRIAGVSSFGITGTDAHAIVQEPPIVSVPPLTEDDERPLHILKISAKSPESFNKLLDIYENMLITKENVERFADLAHSANTGRATFNHRAVIIAKDSKDAANVLRNKSFQSVDVQSTGSTLCFHFTGQGSQYPNMAATLFNTSPIFRNEFNKCDQFLTKQYGINLKQVLWGKSTDGVELSRTMYSQTSIFCVEYCLLKLWESWGVKPDYVMGHSLGEFTAAVAAGALDFEDALMLVAERSLLIDNLPRGKMLVLQADKKTVDRIINDFKQVNQNFWVDYAALNSSAQTVVAGDSKLIEEFAQYCGGRSLKTTVLAATHAFHSRHMEPMLEAYRMVAQKVKHAKNLKDPCPKYISGMEGKLIDLESIDADYWVRHTREPVKFQEACKVIQSENCSIFLEIGPHPILSALTMMNMEGQSVICLPSIRRNEQEWATMLESLSKLYLSEWKGQVNWEGFDRYYKLSRVSIPFYPFNRKPFWAAVEAELPTVHPLLGKVLPTDCEHSIFESRLTLKNTSFIQDHVIGNTVIFPGAAFLEICLAGGSLTTQGTATSGRTPKKPIILRDLKIVSPLAFYDSGICRLQTLSTLAIEGDNEASYSLRVTRHVPSASGGIGEWITHATANVFSVPPQHNMEQSTFGEIDIPFIQSAWEKTNEITKFYDKLQQVGLHFGPKFRSLETCWRSDKGMLFEVKGSGEENEKYLIHPVITDAMIQATMLWTSRDRLKVKLQVPVQVGEFMWLQAPTIASLYIYCTTTESGKTDCILLDGQRTRLALMRDVDFVETSVKLVEGAIHQQTRAMPKLWREMWKSSPGTLQVAYDPRTITDLPFLELTDQQKLCLADINDIGEGEKRFQENICNLTRLLFLNCMYEIGWKPKQGVQFDLEDLVKLLPKPKEHFKKYIRFFLRSMVDIGMLVEDAYKEDRYYFGSLPPNQADIDRSVKKIINLEDSSRIECQMAVEIGRNLPKILLGKDEALQILFTEDPNKPNAAKFYQLALVERVLPILTMLNESLIMPMFSHCNTVHIGGDAGSLNPPVLRVLEVGAGTGGYSKHFLEHLEMWGKPIEFHFTDISPSFFQAAEKKFEKYSHCMVFKKLNMEEDAMAQGFRPLYFDMIIACEVLHIAKDIRKTLRNLKRLLKPGGIFQISETTQPNPIITQIFGLLEGYWQFEDLDFRPNHATLTPDKWEQALREINCDNLICTPVHNNIHSFIIGRLSPQDQYSNSSICQIDKPQFSWLIFYHELNQDVAELLKNRLVGLNRKVHAVKRPPICTESGMKALMKSEFNSALEGVDSLEGVIYLWGLSNNITNRDQSQISLPLVNLVQEMNECTSAPRLYVLTQGTAYVDGFQITDPTAGTLIGIIKSLTAENISMHLNCLDLSPDEPAVCQVGNIFQDLWGIDRSNGNIAYRDNVRSVCKLIKANISNNEPLPLPSGSTRFQLQLPHTKMISDLEFVVLGNYTLGENEVEVEIKATGLNFRDVFAVLKPTERFDQLNSVGVDFAGVVTKLGSKEKVTNLKVGDRVIGINNNCNLALPSHIRIEKPLLIPLPPPLTFTEGATLPVVFCTVLHCLIRVAKMKRGETVLIHTASGGVGLIAIQLAKHIGAEVIATAGSTRKRNYLRNLGIKHVFHSRSTQFGKQILELTDGRGVDIVLNSITGEGFKEASLAALAQNGCFIEMSKLNVWKPEEVKEMRPDVFYEIMDLMAMDTPEIHGLLETLKEFLAADYIGPTPYERFDAVNIRGALDYLQKAKHIGKIVCVMPEVQIQNSKITWTTPMFNEFSTYLVTGGLGGIGFEVVKWMLNNGAKHIAIASRSKPKSEVASQVESWNKRGKHVETFAVDIGDFHQCEHLFQELQSPSRGFPQLRGVMHVAGVLADAILANQTWSKFNHTYNPKVNGTWNLHDLTKDLLLEHFVTFSSASATFGSPGQSNHAASNSFEDSLIAYRRFNGLPATTVNWGNWGEIGVATEVDFPGIRPITTSQGLLALETFLKTQTSHITVFNVESFDQVVKWLPQLKSYVEDKGLFGDVKASVTISSDDFWNNVDNAKDQQERILPFKTLIKSTLKNILKMNQDEQVHDLLDFHTLGIDSLMMLELKNGLQNILGSRLVPTASQLRSCNNTEEMANQLLRILDGKDDLHKITYPTMEELRKLIREDSILPEELRPSEEMQLMHVSEIQNVLMTGVTGTLGPYILRELSSRPNIKKIYCLVRKTLQASPMERLIKRLHAVRLVDHVDLTKVECIQGDVTQNKFGLTEREYARLANDVDAIFNSAVKIDYTARYHKATENQFDLRTVNVKGTIRILEFAVHTKLKHVYHASTILAINTTNEEGLSLEDWQDVGGFDQIPFNWGYPVSKHISEQLCRQAVERGIPCKVFRLPLVGGDSKTGRCDYATNYFVLRWLAFLKLNCMPDTPIPISVMSVDDCAQVSLEVFFNPRALHDVYNVVHRNSGDDLTIIKIAEEFGIHIKPVAFSEFVEKLKLEMDGSPLAPFQTLFEDDGLVKAVYAEYKNPTMTLIKKHLEHTTGFFESRQLPQLIQNYGNLESTESVIRRDLMFLKESGVFEKFGIPIGTIYSP